MTVEELIEYHFSNTLGLSSGAYLADALSDVIKLHNSCKDCKTIKAIKERLSEDL